MKKFNITKDFLLEEFVNKGKSTFEIAKEVGCFPTQIRRLLKKYGIPVRDRSDARKLAIQQRGHHMEGKERTEEEKLAISMSLQTYWDDMSDEEADERRKKAAQVAMSNWEALSDEEKKLTIEKLHKGNKRAAQKGSKNENAIAAMLKERGYKVFQRTTEFTPACTYEIDIALPDYCIAIEIDGPTHWSPVYGEENLQRVQEKDDRKDQMLMGCGWAVVRCRDHSSSPSKAICRRIVDQIVDGIENKTFKTRKVHFLDMK